MKTLATIIITSLLTGAAFYFVMTEDFNSIRKEESHYVDHVTLDNAKLKQFIIYENKGLSQEQFKQKYSIKLEQENKKTIEHKLLYFTFSNGVLIDVE